MKFKVSFQLPPNRFCICWVLDVWTLNEIWQNRVFSQLSLLFLCVKSGILPAKMYISFAFRLCVLCILLSQTISDGEVHWLLDEVFATYQQDMESWEWRYGNFIHVEWTWTLYFFRYSHQAWCFWRYRFRLQKAFKMVFNCERILIHHNLC